MRSLDELPDLVVYALSNYLSFHDLVNLSRTCQRYSNLIDRNTDFWKRLIQKRFGYKVYERYAYEMFQNQLNSDFDLYDTDEDRKNFEKQFSKMSDLMKPYLWLWNMLNCQDNSDGYVAYQRRKKQKSFPRTDQLRMSWTIEQLFEYYRVTKRNFTGEKICQISSYKLIYFHLIQSKRSSCLQLFPIILYYPLPPSRRMRTTFETYELDMDSSTGQCVRLDNRFSNLELGIKGTFQSILPGIYQIICRIKLDKNEIYSPKDQKPSSPVVTDQDVECYFYALPDYGIECECDGNILNYHWFESNYSLYKNTMWFDQVMGQIQVFKLSTIYFGFKIVSGHSYRTVLFDYIQLNIA